jgi:hypothetical protein
VTGYATDLLTTKLLLALASTVFVGFESHGTHGHILPSQIWDYPNLQGQVPIFISPRNRVAQLYPQVLGSLFVASYDSQGYGGGIRTRLHKGTFTQRVHAAALNSWFCLYCRPLILLALLLVSSSSCFSLSS